MTFANPLSPRLTRAVSFTLLFVCLWAIIFWVSVFRFDPDFGWHLASGQYIAAHGIPTYDLFSYTMPSFHWINHEWLNDVFLSWIYSFGGYGLLALVYGAFWSLAIWLAGRKHTWFVALLSVVALMPYLGIRPIVWSALGLVLLERLLEKRSMASYAGIMGLMLVWANLHGSFFLGLVLLVGTGILRRPVDKRLWFTAGVSSLLTLVNPYGWMVYVEIFRTMLDTKIHWRIAEWSPMLMNQGFWIYTVLLVATFWLIEGKKLQWKFAIPATLLAMSISSVRHTVIYVMASLRYLEHYLSETMKQVPMRLRRWLAIGGGILIVGLFVVNMPFERSLQLQHYAPEAINYLRAHPCSGHVFNDYDFGGYLIWQLPGTKTYIDGRMPSWSDSRGRIFDRYDKMYEDKAYRDQQIATYDIRCALITRRTQTPKLKKQAASTLEAALKSAGWREAWSDTGSILLVRD